MVMGLAYSANAVDRAQLNDEIQSLTAKFTALEQNPTTRVPANKLAAARGIILLDRTGGAFVFGYHGGNGVALVKEASGHWSAPMFVSSTSASLGAQIGGSKDFFVILLMSPRETDKLKQSAFNFGAKASVTGTTEHYGVQETTASGPVLVYSMHNGLFAGAEIKGGSIGADNQDDHVYYGRPVSANSILFSNQVSPSQTEDRLIAKLSEYSR